jgi:hypothetical protein
MPDFAYLKSDLINTTENDSSEFSSQVSVFVRKAEERLSYSLDDFGLDEFNTVSVSSGNAATVSLNDRVKVVRNVNFVTSAGSSKTNLLPRTLEYINDYWPVSASTGTPRYYAHVNNTSLKIVPTPVSVITTQIQSQSQPLALASATGTSVTTTNYFSETCYNALFNACMIEATIYMKDWDHVALWSEAYTESLNGLRNQALRTRQDDMANAASPAGGPNTVIQGAN